MKTKKTKSKITKRSATGKTIRVSSPGRLKAAMMKSAKTATKRKTKPAVSLPVAPLLVSVSGIRGIVGQSFTPEVVTRYAAAFGTWANAGKIVIGRDSRVSGEMARTAVISALMATGCRIVDIGIATTPTTEIAVRDLKAHGGIAITASHNPVEWNALKLIGPNGIFLTESQASEVYEMIHQNQIHYVGWDHLGKVEFYDHAAENHIERILATDYIDTERIRENHYRVVIDCINGAGGVLIPRLLKDLGCEVITINEQPHGIFPRNPEPSAEHLGTLQEAVRQHQADIGFAVDPDADRLAVVDETGMPLGEEYTLALAVHYILSCHAGPVVVNASTSMVIDKIAERYQAPVYRTKIGEIHVSMKMKDTGAVIGGEGNGGVIWPEVHYGRDAATGIALILQQMALSGKTISQLKKILPQFVMIKKKVHSIGLNTEPILKKIRKDFKKQPIDETDGVKILFENGWAQLRQSNTEPVIRIMAEAPTIEEANRLITLFTSYFSK